MRTLVSSVTHAGDAGLSKCGLLEGSSLTFDLQLFLSSLSPPHPGILLSSEHLPLSEIIDATLYFLLLLRSGAQESPGDISLGGGRAQSAQCAGGRLPHTSSVQPWEGCSASSHPSFLLGKVEHHRQTELMQ